MASDERPAASLRYASLREAILRRPPIGRAWLRLRRALDFGPTVEIRTFVAKHRYLRAVLSFPPLESGTGPVDCFMLLNELRIWEGLWSLYSFRAYFGPCRIVVLNDGTLRPASIALLSAIFPGITIPDCETNDREIDTYLAQQGLRRCREWRKGFIFFRKLVDTTRLRQADGLLLLDSDCLHFRVPLEIRRWAERPAKVRYAADVNQYSHCADPSLLAKICGSPLPEYFCAGYLCLPRDAVDLGRIERYLSEDCFERQLSTGRFTHVAEQTLYAMEAAVTGATMLPTDYATCPNPDIETPTIGHFCGGSYQRTWFYTKGVPLLVRQLQSRKPIERKMEASR